MPYMEFYHGLRERNWTSKYYNPHVDKWDVQFYKDSGRLLRPIFKGYRALITRGNGKKFWVDLPYAGLDTFLRDYSSGGYYGGAFFSKKRIPREPGNPSEYGYNQVFEQIFQASEERLTPEGEKFFTRGAWWVPEVHHNPAPQLIDVAYNYTKPEFSLHFLWMALFNVVVIGGLFGGIFAAVIWQILRKKKKMPQDMQEAIEFAQSKGTARREGQTGISFADVGGLGDSLYELNEIVAFLKDPYRYVYMDAKPPKGVLLSGDPGVGKTLIAKAIAGEAGVPFYQFGGSEFVEGIVGVGASRIRDMFRRARAFAPCIIFIDEVDALGIQRGSGGGSTNEEREQTLNQLLTEMDGFEPGAGILVIGATNRYDLLDSALIRAGRFDRKILIPRPDEQGRLEILKIHARKHPLGGSVDLLQLAKDLPGLSGAELMNVLNEAALNAVRRQGEKVEGQDINVAIDRLTQGLKQPGISNRYSLKRVIALREAGIALICTLLHRRNGHIEPVERLSLIQRGMEDGRTYFARKDDEDYLFVTKSRLLDKLRVHMGGRAAEDVGCHGEVSTITLMGMAIAKELATRIVANYGMSDLGFTSYAPLPHESTFETKGVDAATDRFDDLVRNVYAPSWQPSDETWHRIKVKVQEVLVDAYYANVADLTAHEVALNAIADALLEKRELSSSEIESIIDAHPPKPTEGAGPPRGPGKPYPQLTSEYLVSGEYQERKQAQMKHMEALAERISPGDFTFISRPTRDYERAGKGDEKQLVEAVNAAGQKAPPLSSQGED